jgi:hypothetical protein
MAKLRREIEIWGRKLGLRASPLAPVVYRQEFGTSLTGDILQLIELEKLGKKMQKIGNDIEKNPDKITSYIDEFASIEEVMLGLLKVVYALNRTDNYGKNFPEFHSWLDQFGYVDFTDAEWAEEVVSIIVDGFFRQGGSKGDKA